MRGLTDPLALDPLGPMDLGPREDRYAPSDPLALDPLSPPDVGRIDGDGPDSEHTSE